MTLQPITDSIFFLPGAVNIGIIATGDGGAIAIDSGLNKDAARTIRKAVEAAGLKLHTIINTHHHADHIGGNAYLLRVVPELQVYAPPLESALIANPILEPVYLHLGACPHAALHNRWLLADRASVHHIAGDLDMIQQGKPQTLVIKDVSLEIVPLAGHSIAQIGIAIDGVCFASDGFFGQAVLEKYGVPYAHDIAAQLASLERLQARNDTWFVPGHGDMVAHDTLADVVHINRTAIQHASAMILDELPGELATVTKRVLKRLEEADQGNRPSLGIPQYAIFASAIAAHLTYLEQQQQAQIILHQHNLIWEKT